MSTVRVCSEAVGFNDGLAFDACLRTSCPLAVLIFSLAFAGCAPHARIVNETPTGGTVIYTYVKEQDVVSSPSRKDALRLLDEKCPSGYRVSREGRSPSVTQAIDNAWKGQVSRDGQVSLENHWAIQFSCK